MQTARVLAQRQLLTQSRRQMAMYYTPKYNKDINYLQLYSAYITHPALAIGIPAAAVWYINLYNNKENITHQYDTVLSATTFKEDL